MEQLRAGEPADVAPVVPGTEPPAGPGDLVEPTDPGAALDVEALRRKLESLPVIEQAKGMLMGYYGIDAAQAFALLGRWSSRRHVKLRDLCREVVERGAVRGSEPYAGLRSLLDHAGLSTDPRDRGA